ncbi:hypothetical protein [Roseibium algae]|uniref:Uncharacterized protein n=1 Tax=Roseibium algae TaxID=3123038 RepID=A0ABU8TSF8_9HYPH
MSLSTTEAVREVFVEATRQSLARSLKQAEDWDRFNAIIDETNKRVKAEESDYARNYAARLTDAKEVILREEHSVRLDQPLPPGAHKTSDRQALHRKADARVQRDHKLRLDTIQRDELDQYKALKEEIRMRDSPTHQARQSFTQTHHRNGPSRDR